MNTHKPFVQRKDGAIFSGVCNGIAAYASIDVRYVRLSWLAMWVIFGVKALLLYAVLMLVVPYAQDEARSSALLDAQIVKSHIVRSDAAGLLKYLVQSWNEALRRGGLKDTVRAEHG